MASNKLGTDIGSGMVQMLFVFSFSIISPNKALCQIHSLLSPALEASNSSSKVMRQLLLLKSAV